jgi:DME family drug/metabolite transporter
MRTGPRQPTLIAGAAAATAACLMGLLGVFVRPIAASAEVIALVRFGGGALFLVSFLALKGDLGSIGRPVSPYTVASGCSIAFSILFYVKAIKLTALASAAFLLYLGSLLAVGLAFVVLAERPSAIGAVLLVAAVVGCTLIVGFDPVSGASRRLGNMFGLAAAVCYASFIVANRKIPCQVTLKTRACHELLLGTVALLPFVALSRETLAELYADFAWVLATAFVQGFLAITLAVFALEFLKAYQYGIISYLEPVVAAVVGALLYGEVIGLLQGLGVLLILTAGLGQALALRRYDRETPDG